MFTQELVYEGKFVNQMLNGQGGNSGLCIKQEAGSLYFYFAKKILKAIISYDSL